MGGIIVTMKIDLVLLIIIAAVTFVGAFIVAPFFFGKCFIVKKFTRVAAADANELLANAKSLSKIEVNENKVLLTRASEDVNRVKLEVAAKGKHKMNKKVLVIFGKEDTVELIFNAPVESLYLVEINEKGSNSIYLSNAVSAFIIAAIQFVVVSGVIALFVFSYSGFNDCLNGRYSGLTKLWFPNYNFAYLSCAAGLVVGIISFVLNLKSMKFSQKPLNLNFLKLGGKK